MALLKALVRPVVLLTFSLGNLQNLYLSARSVNFLLYTPDAQYCEDSRTSNLCQTAVDVPVSSKARPAAVRYVGRRHIRLSITSEPSIPSQRWDLLVSEEPGDCSAHPMCF